MIQYLLEFFTLSRHQMGLKSILGCVIVCNEIWWKEVGREDCRCCHQSGPVERLSVSGVGPY